MATYAKILKDNADNQILPYTRAKLVYMDDNTTVQEAVTRPATNAQMGRVLIGNNLEYDSNGTISLSKSGVCNALGYIPFKSDYTISVLYKYSTHDDTSSVTDPIYNNGIAICNLFSDFGKYFSRYSQRTLIYDKFIFGYFYGTLNLDLIANSTSIEINLILETLSFSGNAGTGYFSFYSELDNGKQTTPSGSIYMQVGTAYIAGSRPTNNNNNLSISIIPSISISSGYTIYYNFFYPLK